MLTISIAAIFTDLILCLTPARMIWYSDLPKPQRVRLIIVFSTCLLTTIVSSSTLVRHIEAHTHAGFPRTRVLYMVPGLP